MGIKRRVGTNKQAPKVLSIDFLIQNHADIASIVLVIISLGLIFEPTSRYSTKFVTLQHNATDPLISLETRLPMLYNYGINDVLCVIFYCLACVVVHGVIQQYLLDRYTRKLHLSKIKHSKFNESGQLASFCFVSLVWAIELARREQLFSSLSSLWIDYPGNNHRDMTAYVKFYFIIQIAYWLHCLPELFFQRVKKEELSQRITYSILYVVYFTGAYLLNFTKIALILAILHYVAEAAFHLSRILYFSQKDDLYPIGFKLWNVLFLLARLASTTLSVLTFVLGLGQQPSASQPAFVDGNFNTLIVRYATLMAVFVLQGGLLWRYLVFHLERRREQAAAIAKLSSKGKVVRRKET